MIIDIDHEPTSWYKQLYIHVSMYLKWNCLLTRWIYRWYSRRYCKQFATYTFPVIKNLSERLLVEDLIEVQPMNVPSGRIFYLDYIHTKKKWWQFWKKY